MLNWPSINPENFSKHRPPSDPATPSKMKPTTYQATHNRTLPPPGQVITTEPRNMLIVGFNRPQDEKAREKRRAEEQLTPEDGAKKILGYWSA